MRGRLGERERRREAAAAVPRSRSRDRYHRHMCNARRKVSGRYKSAVVDAWNRFYMAVVNQIGNGRRNAKGSE